MKCPKLKMARLIKSNLAQWNDKFMSSKGRLNAELLSVLANDLKILPDKPQETVEATLLALWWKVCGAPLSVVAAATRKDIPALTASQEQQLRELIALRLSGVPLAHITGRQSFMGLELLASPDALVPRKETELLGEAALDLLRDMAIHQQKNLVYLDVCTGAGNLPVALLSQLPCVTGWISDFSAGAVHLAQQNIELFSLENRVSVRKGDLLAPFDSEEFHGKVDLLTCNPPYISSGKVPEMNSEISDHEPELAFDGGPFGITILRRLVSEAPKFLKPGGWLAFEVGLGQGTKMVKRMEKKYDYTSVLPIFDEHGDIRAITAQM